MVRDVGGLNGTRNMSLEEIVAMFLYTLAHHLKNRTIRSHFFRSGESVSRNFHRCLLAVLKLHTHLLKKPTPITEDCENCLGALDGTHISVHVPSEDRARYRTRKGSIAMNVFSNHMNEMNKHMSTIASAFSTTQLHEQAIMAREEVEENQKKKLVSELLRIEGLTRFEVMEASKSIEPNSFSLVWGSESIPSWYGVPYHSNPAH
ncbi:uncharacterized protein LOC130818632 [Amaranthus tricolor]|uniref:uncharacterized protein LOC130818632 n=1 Tax=Amaranthus tricolor TaxID=29722 RepID=UPI0025876C6A|nr:uncharacterized protein LOC130818632 [Amaranthus tricolor]